MKATQYASIIEQGFQNTVKQLKITLTALLWLWEKLWNKWTQHTMLHELSKSNSILKYKPPATELNSYSDSTSSLLRTIDTAVGWNNVTDYIINLHTTAAYYSMHRLPVTPKIKFKLQLDKFIAQIILILITAPTFMSTTYNLPQHVNKPHYLTNKAQFVSELDQVKSSNFFL